jgi:formyl-CoA transferase
VLKCKGAEADPNAHVYFTIQERTGHKAAAQSSGRGWIYDPGYNSAEACQPHIFDIFDEIEQWLADETNYKAVDILRKYEVPCTILAELGYDTQTVARMRDAGVVG